MAIVTDLCGSLEGYREWESDRGIEREDQYTRGDCASYDKGKALRKWPNRNKAFKILTVDSIRE